MNEPNYQQLAAQLRQPSGEAGRTTGEWMNRGNVHINMDTIAMVDAKPGDNILEIGMGNGFFVKNILQPNDDVHYSGADFSEVMVEEAKKINKNWIDLGRAKFILSDAAALPFADNTFNKIFTINTIYFWDDAVKILAELKRVLVAGGKLIVTLRPKHLMEAYPFTQYGFIMFTKEEVTELFSQNGFFVTQAIEKQEPDFELNGKMMKIESLIIESVKK